MVVAVGVCVTLVGCLVWGSSSPRTQTWLACREPLSNTDGLVAVRFGDPVDARTLAGTSGVRCLG